MTKLKVGSYIVFIEPSDMHSDQAGFTLIELTIVIVILGILAAIAIPKYISLTSDANTAATKGVAGALASGNVINYAARSANATKGQAIANCTDVSGTIAGGLPSGYTITAATIAPGATVSCILNGPGATTATFTANGIT